LRVISGQKTTITGPGIIGANKIGVSSDGRLFVAEPNNRILVFAPGAAGNVSPSQVIHDTTTGTGLVDQGGIGVRSCSCD
jgi:sugar lactone lactonase YvrE